VQAETERLEEGIIRFTIQGVEPSICQSEMYTAEWVYFVTYRENDNSPFSLAVDVNGQIWPYFGKQTVMSQNNNYKIFIGDFNIPGQYRVIINPPDAFRLNAIG
jgi:hypothetical protein